MQNIQSRKIIRNKLRFGKNNLGTSMIEVMVAVLILGVGLLGIAAMQALTLKNGQSSLERSQAVMQTYGILDSMRANMVNARTTTAYVIPRTCTIPTGNATLAQRDLITWMTGMQNTLGPTSCGTIGRAGDEYIITVEWNDSLGSGGSATQTAVTRSRI